MKNKQRVVRIIFDSFLSVIKNSVGSKLFRNFYAKVNGKKKDIIENGNFSCAFYVSSVLFLFKFIKDIHGTVNSTIKDLRESGWITINKPRIGSILVWEKIDFGKKGINRHIGFYVGKDKAISTSSKRKCVVRHHWTFNSKRKVELIFWNPKLK